MVQAVGSYNIQFNALAMIENGESWIKGFNALAKEYGVGIVCENEWGGIVTFFPDQKDTLLAALKNYFDSADLSWEVIPNDNEGHLYDVIIHEMDGATSAACNNLKTYGDTYNCYNQDYCGDKAPADSLHPDGNSAFLSPAASSATYSPPSASLVGTASGPEPTSNSNSGSNTGSNSEINSGLGAPSNTGLEAASQTVSERASNPPSQTASERASDSVSNTLSDTLWSGYCANCTEGPTTSTTRKPFSTKLITVTSCSNHVCSEAIQTTGVTVVTEEHTTYTTYCPLDSFGGPIADSTITTLAPSTSRGVSSASTFRSTTPYDSSSGLSSSSPSSSSPEILTETTNGAWKMDHSLGSLLAGAVVLLL